MMKRISKFILAVASAAISVSCVEDIVEGTNDQSHDGELVEMTFKASYANTKTTLVNGVDVWWMPGDNIRINGNKFVAQATEPSPVTYFSGATSPSDVYYAVYPDLRVNESWSGDDYTIVTVDTEQVAIKDNIPEFTSISVAKVSDISQELYFRNVIGYVKFVVTEDSWDIVKVRVESNGGEALSGFYKLSWNGDDPIAEPFEEGTFSYVSLVSESSLEPDSYYIALMPGTYEDGLTFRFESSDGKVAIKKINQSITLDKGNVQNIGVMDDLKDQLAVERESLIAFYNATGGDNWICNDNWCSDRPLDEWYGIETFSSENTGRGPDVLVSHINLPYNGLTGNIPKEIRNFTSLQSLILDGNALTGEIPSEIGNLHNLSDFNLAMNQLSGNLPKEIGNLDKLQVFDISGNDISGEYPSELASCMDNIKEYHFDLSSNSFSGDIPESILNHPRFVDFWSTFLNQKGRAINYMDIKIPAPKGIVKDMNGATIDLKELYADNDLTVLYTWNSWCPFSQDGTNTLIPLYNAYKDKGLGVLGYVVAANVWPLDTVEDVTNTLEKQNVPWNNVIMLENEDYEIENFICALFKIPGTPSVIVVDSEGNIVYQPVLCTTGKSQFETLPELLAEHLGDVELEEPDYYESTDYSTDEEVVVLQSATKGTGIDIVFMGDAFTDADMAEGGEYEKQMRRGMEALFLEEPMKSFRDYFNVYAVKAVSKHNIIADGMETALGTSFEGGTRVGGDDGKCYAYASKAPIINFDNLLIICLMNVKAYAGTCYMVPGSASIAYFPLGYDDATFAGLLNHEAVGHGFGKLMDEYESNLGAIPEYEVASYNDNLVWGWGANVDVVSDPATVKWADFLQDDRYSSEGLGVFEGALTYQFGAYRPSENSIMRYNTGGFNAPSRYEIYRRIMEYSGGVPSYEDFVECDARNRTSSAQAQTTQKRRANYVERAFEPTHPPVIVKGSWRDAVK